MPSVRRLALASAVVVIALIVGAGFSYLHSASPIGASSSTKPSTEIGTGESVVSSSVSGLKLELSLNTTNLGRSETIAIEISEFNPENLPVNVSAQSDWATHIVGIGMPPCDFENEPISLAVAAGNYSVQNFTNASPLQLSSNSLVYHCAPVWSANYWVFQPMSNVTQLGGCLDLSGLKTCSPAGLVFSTSQVVEASGTYTVAGQSEFSPFPPGTYTAIAGDEWGAIAILRFEVIG